MRTVARVFAAALILAGQASLGQCQDANVSSPVAPAPASPSAPAEVMGIPTVCGSATAAAPAGSPFDGSLWDRPVLLGSVFGVRDSLAESGITINVDNYEFYQGVASGGISRSFEYAGRNDYFMNVNGEKAGLWKGLFIDLHGETRYGNTVNFNTGAIMPVNTAEIFPAPNGNVTALTAVKVTQALSENVLTFAGKLNMLDTFNMPFTGARALDGFWNLGLAFPTVVTRTVPYSTLGAGGVILKDGAPVFTLLVLDTNNTPTTTGFESFFNNGATILSNVIVPTKFFDMPGQQGLTGTFSSGKYNSLQPTAYFDPNVGLVVVSPLQRNSWSLFYTANQALWVDPTNAKRMYGVMTTIGLADDGPSPIRFGANVALYGSSPLPNRPLDTFGIGYGVTQYSSPVRQLAPVLLPVDTDHVVELFYNVGVTKWFSVAPDLQVIVPARGATLPPGSETINTALVLGMRAKIDF